MSDPSMVERISADVARDAEKGKAIGAPGAGPAIDNRKPWEKWPRKVEIFTGDVPIANGATQTKFRLSRVCDVKDKQDKKCGEPLIAERVLNFHFVPDTVGTGGKPGGGGQLEYDRSDARYYVYCELHGPKPSGPPRW